MLIFLVGYMGCGKSSIGRPLSELMGYKFIDLDSHIEDNYKMSVVKIFARYGERAFRMTERRLLIEMCENEDNCIVSTGGGTPCYRDNIDIMNMYGCTIYLNLDSDVLVTRLANTGNKRPILLNMDSKELGVFIKNSLQQREEFYSKSKITIRGKNINTYDLFRIINMYEE